MNMNKILLVLIIASGFLLIFYANNDMFSRKNFWSIFQRDNQTITSTNSNNNNYHHHKYQLNQFGNSIPQSSIDLARDGIIGRDTARIDDKVRQHQNNNQNSILLTNEFINNDIFLRNFQNIKRNKYVPRNGTEYNIFVIYTKETFVLKTKYELFLKSLLKYTTIQIHLHIIVDENSEASAEEILKEQIHHYKRIIFYTLYDVKDCASKINDITRIMMPHFNSNPGSYYSDALFYLSLGLYRIVDEQMQKAILVDCDIVFRSDVKYLFGEFDKFSLENLFGLAPELTPVYRHILYKYRGKNPTTNFGNPYYRNVHLSTNNGKNGKQPKITSVTNKRNKKHGYPGLNSGIVLMDFTRIRKSKFYIECLKEYNVNRITEKYSFKGHLGDQDYYTLLGYEYPNLIHRLDCIWNRQLCTWWKEHGYSDIFDTYFHCDGKIKIYHGNCNTRVPE